MPKSILAFLILSLALVGCGASSTSNPRIPVPAKAPPAEQFQPSNSPASAEAIASLKAGSYSEAANLAGAVINSDSGDMVARFVYASALVALGDYERGRKQLSLAMAWHPRVVDAYPKRAVCAVWMGDPKRAAIDMETARMLDPQDASGLQAWAKKEIEKALKSVSDKDPASLSKELVNAARSGKDYHTLQELADELLKTSNANRYVGDETYAEHCRMLDWLAAETPEDPDRWFRFGRFLLEELEVHQHRVGASGNTTYYRMQDRHLRRAEIERARAYFQQALNLDPNHVGALIGMGRLEAKLTMWANAESYMRKAMAVGEPDPEVLHTMRHIMAVGAGQNFAISQNLTRIRQWSEKIGNYVYQYTSYPTAAAYRQARKHDQMTDRLMRASVDYRNAVLNLHTDDARTHDYIALLARSYKDYESAERGWKKALSLNPDDHNVSYALAEVYARQNRIDDYLEQSTKTWTNGRHTTSAHYLRWAWERINQQQWDKAANALEASIEVDPGDARSLAFLGVIAESKGNRKEAKAYYKAAFALEEAHAKQRGASYISGNGFWYPVDLGLALEMRMRLAMISEDEGQPGDALMQYQGVFAMEKYIGDFALDDDLPTAMLPVPGVNYKTRPHAPRWGEYMRTSRALAGYLLYKAGKHDEAEAQFRMLRDYEKRMTAAGIRAGRYLSDTVWKSKPVAEAAYDIFKRRNDDSQYHWWNRERTKYRPASSGDWRRNKAQHGPDLSTGARM